MALPVSDAPVRRPYTPPPPPPPPAPRKEVDPAVRQPALHQGKRDAPPPERYVQHEVERGENLTDTAIVTRNQGGSIDLGVPRTLWIGLRVGQ